MRRLVDSYHLLPHVRWLGLRRLRHRRVQSPGRRLAPDGAARRGPCGPRRRCSCLRGPSRSARVSAHRWPTWPTEPGSSRRSTSSGRSGSQPRTGPGRSARPRGRRGARRCSRRSPESAVELRRGEKRRRPQDLVGSAELFDLTLKISDSTGFLAGHAGPVPLIDLGLDHPVPQRLRVDPQLSPDPPQCPDRVAGSRRASTANLTARSRSSSGYFLGAPMTHILTWNQSLHRTRHETQLYKVEYRDNGGDLCEWCKRTRAPCGCFKRFSGSAMLGPHRRGRRGVGDGQP